MTDLAQHVCDLLADNKRLQDELERVTAELKEANEALTVAYLAGAERGKDSAFERGQRAGIQSALKVFEAAPPDHKTSAKAAAAAIRALIDHPAADAEREARNG